MPDFPFLPHSKPPVRLWRYLLTSCLVLLACIILGCMTFSFGPESSSPSDDLLEQEGEFNLSELSQTVYYPIPFASPPNLTLGDNIHHAEIEEQAADHFKVRFHIVAIGTTTWKAKGIHGARPSPPEPVYTTPPVPAESAKR